MRRATDRIGQEAQEIVRTARDEGKRAIDDVKNRAADRAEEMARAADAAASELEKSGDGAISGYGHSLASMMRQLAGGLRERDIDEFAAELAQFARRHPAAFLAGSVAVGFGIARILRSQNGGSFVRRARSETEFYGDYGDYDEDYREYDERYEAGEYDSGRWGSEYGSTGATGSTGSTASRDSAQRDRGTDSYTARDYGSSSRKDSGEELPGGRYTPGNTGVSSASSTSGYGGDESREGDGGLSGDGGIAGGSRNFGGADQSGLYGDRPDSGSGLGSESASSSTTASPTSAPASSGVSANRDYRTASPDGDPFGASDGSDVSDEDRPIETPESEATRGPRKGDLP